MTTLFDFQFPESHKIIFYWDVDVRPKSEIHPISVFKNFEFPAPVWVLGRGLKLTREHLAVVPCKRLTQFLYH